MLLIRTIGAFFAVYAFSWYLALPHRLMLYAALSGAANWFIYLTASELFKSEILAVFFSTLIVAGVGHLVAPLLKAPAFVLFLPGILPVIPGMPVYYAVSAIVQNDTTKMISYFMTTLQIAGAISIGLLLADSLFLIFFHKIRESTTGDD